ncbi:hypothetical protein AVT43_gp62 [Polaribacter phage P12002L]|uniref:Uncharacterized protein n=2 Tax=Incheonvirus TaxID=2976977 RepID=A0A0F7IKM9_9CAUD|nr:hypothetical protein AVT42_gp64 [Polaribacter phage P12002S]YP_009209722.1 hypothetical protein AVT43_gp62 [Polaribacter phage P12002L]AKG94236.1 hypothetical protein P12002L_0062 [Polaribacter phage P12002L]AKG94320.1 hypothetical protein P12002S_0064 [Polaribacter phage P12002S]
MSDKKNELPQIVITDLGLANETVLNEKQLQILFKKTPKKHIYQRPAKGGGNWDYVTGTYVKKVLNLMFNFDWDFEVVEHKFDLTFKQAFVLGKLTVRTNGKTITKMQFGTKDIMFKRNTSLPLDLGNDLKAATTNALKKCASELGIASDVYAPQEFKEIKVVKEIKTSEEKETEIKLLLEVEGLTIAEEERMNIDYIIEQKETTSYDKCINLLNNHLPKKI